MPAKHDNFERLNLTFKAEPAANPPRTTLPGGWLLWCLLGVGIGIGCWLVGRQQLATSLATKLTGSTTAAEAMLAVESLLLLDADASSEIARGLEHPDVAVARTAYRTLNAQISRWQQMEPAVGVARLQTLAENLQSLPDSTPPDNLILASSLASRIFSECLAKEDPQLRPLMSICENVFRRAGAARNRLVSETPPSVEEPASNVPPPLLSSESDSTAAQFTSSRTNRHSFSDATVAETLTTPANAPVDNALHAPAELTQDSLATLSLTAAHTRARTAASTRAIEPELATAGFDESPALDDPLPPQPSATVEPHQRTSPEPVLVVATPASLASVPLVRMKVVSEQADLDGIQDLEIEELVRLLASVQPRVAQAASLALRAKGMSDAQLELASELASGSAARRLDLVQQISSNGQFEPRPWLLWMAEDGEPEVRKLCVSLLSSMMDPFVERSMRILLARERDADVERAMREALVAGSHHSR